MTTTPPSSSSGSTTASASLALIEKKTTGKSMVEAYTSEDLWATIGAAADQFAFTQRTLALTNPDAYKNARNASLEELKKAVAGTFKSTYDAYKAAGVGVSEAKKLATEAAKISYNSGIKALRRVYPSAADSMYQGAVTDKSVMMVNASQRRRAPAKRAKAKKPPQKRR